MGGDGRRWRHPGRELRLIENKIVIVKKNDAGARRRAALIKHYTALADKVRNEITT